MKKILPAICLLLAIAACKKDDGDGGGNPTGPTGPANPMKYSVAGVKDISVQRTDSAVLPLTVQYLSGDLETVSFSVAGQPDKVYIGIDPIADTPNFVTTVKFYTEKAAPGTYNISIKGNTSAGVQNNVMTLTIRRYDNDALNIEGEYAESGNCITTGSVNHNVTVSADAQVQQRVWLKGIWTGASGSDVYADLNYTAHTITIPPQTVNSVVYSGSGTYTDNSMSIHYTIASGVTTLDNCTTTLTKQ